MNKLKPAYWGNIIYESAMGLYYSEQEAKEESWMQEHYFPLYSKEEVEELEQKLAIAKEEIEKAANTMSDKGSHDPDECYDILENALKKLSAK